MTHSTNPTIPKITVHKPRENPRASRCAVSTRLRLAALAAAVAAGVLPQAALAEDGVTGHTAAPTAKKAVEIADYWTTKRMKRAEPLDIERAGDAPSARQAAHSAEAVESEAQGKPGMIGPAPPKGAAATEDETKASAPEPVTRQSSVAWRRDEITDTTTYPYSTQGKIFMRAYSPRHGWYKSSCSATVVNTENKQVIFTAGHCVYDDSRWSRRVAFVPGYRNGSRPFGTFAAKNLRVLSDWQASRNFNYDVAAVKLYPNADGQKVANVVGSRGIAWNQSYPESFYAYGYPADSPFDGSKLYVCSSWFGGIDANSQPGPDPMRIGCDMTGGSSGGGWMVGSNLNSVNSYGYRTEPDHMYGPYFGSAVGNLYNEVR